MSGVARGGDDDLLPLVSVLRQTVIATPSVGEHARAGDHRLAHERQQARCGHIGNMAHPHPNEALGLYNLHRDHHDTLGGAAAAASTMFHTTKNPLKKVTYKSDAVESVKDPEQRKLHKAFLRYHDPNNWPLLRDVLTNMGRADLIGKGKHQLVPKDQPEDTKGYRAPRRKNSASAHQRRTRGKQVLTQHTGLPPRSTR